MNEMNEINEIKLPKGVDSISVTQHDNKIVIEFIPKKSEFKDGDFVYEDGRIMIVKSYPNEFHAIVWTAGSGKPKYNGTYAVNFLSPTFRHATEKERQMLIDAIRKDGKLWNNDKKCVEDIPKRKFKNGDKVTLKSGCISKTGLEYLPLFDRYIGERLEVVSYTENGYVQCDNSFYLHEDWLEPWIEEPKKGDFAIFWDNGYSDHMIRLYHGKSHSGDSYCDNFGIPWDNAVKWDGTKEQFDKVSRGEI